MILLREQQQQQHQYQTVSGGVEKVLLDCVSIAFIIECLKQKVTCVHALWFILFPFPPNAET